MWDICPLCSVLTNIGKTSTSTLIAKHKVTVNSLENALISINGEIMGNEYFEGELDEGFYTIIVQMDSLCKTYQGLINREKFYNTTISEMKVCK